MNRSPGKASFPDGRNRTASIAPRSPRPRAAVRFHHRGGPIARGWVGSERSTFPMEHRVTNLSSGSLCCVVYATESHSPVTS